MFKSPSGTNASNPETVLECPSCGSDYLHQRKTDIYERGEDENSGLHVRVEGKQSTTDGNLEGNPSGRRNGITIQFWCEGCGAKPVMSIYQHKGQTFVDLTA